MNVKELIENRNSKVAQMENLLTTAKAENRLPSEGEKKQFADLEKEVKDIDATVAMYDQMAEMSIKKVPSAPVEMTNAEKDHKMFENAIRGIVNTDTPTMPADAKTLIPTTVWNEIISQVIEISPVFSMADRYNIEPVQSAGSSGCPSFHSSISCDIPFHEEISDWSTTLPCST